MYLSELYFCLDICPGVGLLDHMVILFLAYWGTSILFSIVAAPTYIPTNSGGGFLFSTHSLEFVICRLFNDGHSDRCEVVPYYSFDLHFSNSWLCWAFVHVPIGHLYVFIGKMCLGLLPIFDWVCFFVVEFYEFVYFGK